MTDSEVLSQNEMDALIDGVADGEIEADTGTALPAGTVSNYDFAHPAHKLNSRLPVLDVINEQLAKYLASSLSASLHQQIEVTPSEPDFEKYQDYAHSLPEAVSISQFKLDPLQGNALLTIYGDLIFMMVDSFFGGAGTVEEAKAAREFTPTELRHIEHTREAVFDSLVKAWSSVIQLQPVFQGVLSSGQVTSPANPADVVVTSKFEIKLASGKSECHVVIPFSMLEPLRPQLTNDLQKMREHDAEWLQAFSQQIMDCELELSGVIAESQMTLDQLLKLKPGDFIPLGQSQTVSFSSENIPLFDATVGISNGLVSASLSQWHQSPNHFSQKGGRTL